MKIRALHGSVQFIYLEVIIRCGSIYKIFNSTFRLGANFIQAAQNPDDEGHLEEKILESIFV